MGFDVKASKASSIAIIIILLATLRWSAAWYTALLTLGLIGLMIPAHFIQEGRYLRYFILFMGAIGSVVSLLNILSTTVFNTIEGSDAVVFARECSILVPAFVYGIIWLLISIVIITASICSALITFKS